jgi:hypothetical protein
LERPLMSAAGLQRRGSGCRSTLLFAQGALASKRPNRSLAAAERRPGLTLSVEVLLDADQRLK